MNTICLACLCGFLTKIKDNLAVGNSADLGEKMFYKSVVCAHAFFDRKKK
jgi:hypothetical protein